jgi:hypothetical protein
MLPTKKRRRNLDRGFLDKAPKRCRSTSGLAARLYEGEICRNKENGALILSNGVKNLVPRLIPRAMALNTLQRNAGQMGIAAARQLSAEAVSLLRASGSRWMASSPISAEHDEDPARPTTPWVRNVISGVDLMRNAKVGPFLCFARPSKHATPPINSPNTTPNRCLPRSTTRAWRSPSRSVTACTSEGCCRPPYCRRTCRPSGS